MTKTQPLPNTEITNALPPVQQFGFQNGANSAANSAFLSQIASNNEQMFLIDQHGGGSEISITARNSSTPGTYTRDA